MSNNISDILGLNKRRGRVNLNKYMTNNKANAPSASPSASPLDQATNFTQNKISNAHESFMGLSGRNKVLLIFGILALLLMIGIIIKYYRDQTRCERFLSQPLFMTEIENNKPHNAKKIYRYVNQTTGKATPYIPGYNFTERNGTEYTFSFWMFINNKEWDYRFGDWKHIFHRGSTPMLPLTPDVDNNQQITKLTTQSPGFWLSPKENTLNCVLTTGDAGEERITLEDVPMNKWINIVLVINHNSGSLFMDGKLHKTINLFGKLSSTKDAVYINYFGGYGGNMAYLQFFDKALSPSAINDMYKEYQSKIDGYINHMFKKEQWFIKLPFIGGENKKCNYMKSVKEDKDKAKYVADIISVNKILCENTSGMTETECIKNDKALKGMIDTGIPLTDLKSALKKMIGSMQKIDNTSYKYQTISGVKGVANLSAQDYNRIRKFGE